MTEEQKKKRLSEYWFIEKRVRELEKELTEEFYNMFNSFSSDNPKPKNHEPKSPIENKVCRLVTKEKELRKLQKEKRTIEKALKALKPNEEQIIREHDINGYSIHYISIRNKMSYKYLIALHKKAISKIDF